MNINKIIKNLDDASTILNSIGIPVGLAMLISPQIINAIQLIQESMELIKGPDKAPEQEGDPHADA